MRASNWSSALSATEPFFDWSTYQRHFESPFLVLLICGFVVGYSFKPILDTSRFDLIKNEFESREAILKEQLQCGKLRR